MESEARLPHPDRVPRSWDEWVYLSGEPAVSTRGSPVLNWAVATVSGFYSDEWFAASIDRFDCPVMNMWEAGFRNAGAVVRFVERAVRIALLSHENAERLRPGIDLTSEEFRHMEIILEVCGLAARDGWNLNVEAELETRKKPDLRLEQLGRRYQVEITIQGKSRSVRQSEEFSDALSALTFAIEREFPVITNTVATRIVSEDEIAQWKTDVEKAASEVSCHGVPRAVEHAGIRTTLRAVIEGKGRSYDGPLVAEDAWSRFAVRVLQKAAQTAGGPPTWIRIDELGGLMWLTSAVYLQPHEQLEALVHNLEITLADHSHVVGVVISHSANPNWEGTSPDFTYLGDSALGLDGPAVFERVLQGKRRRRTFLIPLVRGQRLVLPRGSGLPIGRWYADERSWLDWALDELKQPSLDEILND